MKAQPMPAEAIELVARRFAVLSDPMRLRLLQALFQGERNVSELVELTQGTQANVSRHLQTLANAGLVERRKAGLMVFYSIGDPSIFQLCDLVCGSIGKQLELQSKAFSKPPA